MAQQTAVDLFLAAIQKVHKMDWDLVYVQAKAIEKEQISEAYRKGVEEDVYNNPLKTGDEYYNETYLH